jgi:excisionase family DNA binding protein
MVVMQTIFETAEYLKLTPYIVRKMCRAGTLKAAKIGNRWRIEAKAIAALLARDGTK